MKLRRRVPDYTTPDWVHSLQEEGGPRFGEKPLKTTENLGLGSPICPLFWESLDPPPVYFEKKIIGPYIWVNNV
jgi:hypothetical protein